MVMEMLEIEQCLLFSSDAAEKLNEAFRKATASYLFLFCNYNPFPLCRSYGANFRNAVDSMYKLCSDTGKIIKDIFDISLLARTEDQSLWKDYLSRTDNLRSGHAHNNSSDNGADQEALMEIIKNFYLQETSKIYKELEEKDFEFLLERMVRDTEQFCQLIQKMIARISVLPNKQDIIEKCKKKIISYYMQTYRNIVIGQVKIVSQNDTDHYNKQFFEYYLKNYANRQYCLPNSNDPDRYFEHYMKKYFRPDINEFLQTYILQPDATMLPHGLVQEFVDRIVYPIQKGDHLELNLSSMQYYPEKNCFVGKAVVINKLKFNNICVNLDDSIDTEKLEALKNSKKENCIAQNTVCVRDIANRYGVVSASLSQ